MPYKHKDNYGERNKISFQRLLVHFRIIQGSADILLRLISFGSLLIL